MNRVDHYQELATQFGLTRREVKKAIIALAYGKRHAEIVEAAVAHVKTQHKNDADCKAGDHDSCLEALKAQSVFTTLVMKYIQDTEEKADE